MTYARIWCPLPLNDRELYLAGFGIDRLDVNGSIIIISRTVDDDPLFVAQHQIDIPTTTQCTRVKTNYIGTEFTPITRDKLLFKMVSHSDMKLKFMPNSLLNFFLRKFGMSLFEKLIERAKNMKPTVMERYLNDPIRAPFYRWLINRFESHFAQNTK